MNKQRVLQGLENVKSNPYGKWGILNIEQRRFIKELCNSWLILDDATNKQHEEIERLKERIEDLNTINEEHRILNGELRKELQQKENIIKEAKEYIELIKTLAMVDKINIFSISKFKEILDKGKE